MALIVDRLAIIGLGLIGGSIARGARERGLAGTITAWDARGAELDAGLAAGAIDRGVANLPEAVADAELVILAVPVLELLPSALAATEHAPTDAVITDVGSTKGTIVRDMDALAGNGAPFVGGHPIAGTENSGFAAARGNLFDGAAFILTPTLETSVAAATLVSAFWEGLGAVVHRMDPIEHDRLFALISHLPHVVAYALVKAVVQGAGGPLPVRTFAGGGFRDFTRIAASDPVMWRDICLDNREHLLHSLDLLEKEIDYIRAALEEGRGEVLDEIFRTARGMKLSL